MEYDKQTIKGNPWDRQVCDTTKSYSAFCVYRDMGSQRSLPKAGQKADLNARVLAGWCMRFGWVDRCSSYDEYCEAQRLAAIQVEMKKSNEEDAKLTLQIIRDAKAIVAHDMAVLRRQADDDDNEAVLNQRGMSDMMHKVVTLERLVKGESTETVEETGKTEKRVVHEIIYPNGAKPTDGLPADRSLVIDVVEGTKKNE
jgi:hypothetical protein